LLVFDRDLAVADRVQGEDGAAQLPGEVAGRVEVGGGRWVGVDAGRVGECGEVGGEVETGGPVEGHDVSVVGGARELAGVVHPQVPPEPGPASRAARPGLAALDPGPNSGVPETAREPGEKGTSAP
jgi:hypothetical protein